MGTDLFLKFNLIDDFQGLKFHQGFVGAEIRIRLRFEEKQRVFAQRQNWINPRDDSKRLVYQKRFEPCFACPIGHPTQPVGCPERFYQEKNHRWFRGQKHRRTIISSAQLVAVPALFPLAEQCEQGGG